MFRKIAELKKAKSEREKLRAAKELEVAISQAAQDEEAAKIIVKTIEKKRGPRPDYAAVMRDAALLTSIVYQLDRIAKQAALEAREEDDIAVMLLLAL